MTERGDLPVDVLTALRPPDGVEFSVLIPNLGGLENALPYRETFHEGVVFLSASETHNQSPQAAQRQQVRGRLYG